MKNLFRLLIIIVIVLLCNEFNAEAQNRWKTLGYGFHRDTTFVTKVLEGKDSVSYHRDTETCRCAVFRTKDGLMPCDSLLKEHYVTTHWVWQYTTYLLNDKPFRTEYPYWFESFSDSSNVDYQYYYNNKLVYPLDFFSQPLQH